MAPQTVIQVSEERLTDLQTMLNGRRRPQPPELADDVKEFEIQYICPIMLHVDRIYAFQSGGSLGVNDIHHDLFFVGASGLSFGSVYVHWDPFFSHRQRGTSYAVTSICRLWRC